MRHGFIWGIIMLFMLILGLQMFLTGEFTISESNQLGRIIDGYNPETRENEGIFPGELSTFTNASTGQDEIAISASNGLRVAKFVGQASLLYAPALFTGNYVWFWYIFCLPIAVTFWLSILLALFRGVGSGG